MSFSILPDAIRGYLRWLRLRWLFPNTSIAQSAIVNSHCKFDEHVVIHPFAEIVYSSLGRLTYVGSYSRVTYSKVGAFCSIAPGVNIGGYTHPTEKFVSTSPAFFSTKKQSGISFVTEDRFREEVTTTIGHDVWIGYEAVVLPGINVSHGAIIAAGAVVTKDVQPFEVVAGVPATVKRKRFSDEQIEILLRINWWDRDLDWIKANSSYFENIELFIEKIENQI